MCIRDRIKAAVAGIAMGLVKEEEKFVVLSDILGDEDHLGDMDFKVAGTREAVSYTHLMPVVVVADYLNVSEEKRLRALFLSHLMAIYIHSKLPKLSALCAVTTASMGSCAGIAYLRTGKFETVSMGICSRIGDISGIICDGASNSLSLIHICAAKFLGLT